MDIHVPRIAKNFQIPWRTVPVDWLTMNLSCRFLAGIAGLLGLFLICWFGFGTICLTTAWAASPGVITSGENSTPEVALTFDDGPSSRFTPRILDLLKQYQAQGTFFVLGAKVEQHPDLIQEMVQAGHEVGIHSYSHPRLPTLKPVRRAFELERTWLALRLLGCPDTGMVRPPYSDYDQPLLSYLAHTNRELILWNIDSGDWQGLNAVTIVQRVLSQAKNGAIIIFHDSDEYAQADRTPTVEALKFILPALKQAGYRLVTVSDLLDDKK
jgi:peptidoglycan-N-acetylglucosamine deacetylase